MFDNSARRVIGVIAIAWVTSVRAEDSSQGTAPPAITMHLTSVHPRDAIAELVKQTDASIQVSPENLYEQQRGPGNTLPQSIDVNADSNRSGACWTKSARAQSSFRRTRGTTQA